MAKKKTTKKTTTRKAPRKSASADPAKTQKAIRDAERQADKNLKAIAAADQENARVRDERKASPDGQTASERAMTKGAKPTKKKGATRATTAGRGAKGKPKATTAAKAPKAATQASQAKREAGAATPGKAPKGKAKMGLLDAAAQILAKAKEPMACKDIVEQAIAQKLWTTGGKTPHATLNAAIAREITNKGEDARFVKVERGRFQLRGWKGA